MIRWLVAMARHSVVMLGYRVRPYDPHLDARRWAWQRSGRQRSYAAVHRMLAALTPEQRRQLEQQLQRAAARSRAQRAAARRREEGQAP